MTWSGIQIYECRMARAQPAIYMHTSALASAFHGTGFLVGWAYVYAGGKLFEASGAAHVTDLQHSRGYCDPRTTDASGMCCAPPDFRTAAAVHHAQIKEMARTAWVRYGIMQSRFSRCAVVIVVVVFMKDPVWSVSPAPLYTLVHTARESRFAMAFGHTCTHKLLLRSGQHYCFLKACC
ncbi:hypothetical protein EDD22DRAFT_183938 [Suillus occidentalis]|nr:hypothetical protein EDD22DRAFT_183938 [Suillus occidentalis]